MFTLYPYLNVNDLNLDWIIKHFKQFIDALADLDEWRITHEEEYKELKAMYDAIIAGDFPPSMKNALYNWVTLNATSIIGAAIKMVLFGLEGGYFVAYIPDSWSEIAFGTTGLDDFPAGYDFGHLTLTY